MKIAILPARGGSKRIPHKNIIDFLGKPMIQYTLEAVEKSGVFDKIHVSTDDTQIANCVEKMGHKVDFFRPAELANDFSPLLESIRWIWEKYQSMGQTYSTIGLILPCSPLITSEDYKNSMKMFIDKKQIYPLISMTKFPAPTEWAFITESDGTVKSENVSALSMRSQDLKEKYYDTGNFCYFSSDQLMKEKNASFSNYLKYEIPRTRAVDIDSFEDLEIAKILYKSLN